MPAAIWDEAVVDVSGPAFNAFDWLVDAIELVSRSDPQPTNSIDVTISAITPQRREPDPPIVLERAPLIEKLSIEIMPFNIAYDDM